MERSDIIRNTIRHEIVSYKPKGYGTSDIATPMFSSIDVEQIVENIMFHFSDQIDQAKQSEHDKIYALYNEMFEPNGEFRTFDTLKPPDIMGFFERLKDIENENG